MRGHYEFSPASMPWYCNLHGHHDGQFCPQCQEAESQDLRKATVEEQLRFKIEALETALAATSESERVLKRAHELLVSFNNTAQHSGFKCCQCVEVVKNYSRRALGIPQVDVISPLEKLKSLIAELNSSGGWRTPVFETGTMEEIQTDVPFYERVERTTFPSFRPGYWRTSKERPRIEQFDLFEDWQAAVREWEDQPPEET